MASSLDEYGNKRWYDKNGQFHRENGPAIEYRNGTKEWWWHGYLHRVDGPAVEDANGSKFWYRHGIRHREDGPAIIADGIKHWIFDGKRLEVSSQEEFIRYMKLKAFW